MKKIRRFTLVELLAVMAIIAILSGIGFGAYTYANNKAKESSTEALMKQIEAGLESFHTKNGYYPVSGGDFSVVTITTAADGTISGVNFGSSDSELTYNTSASLTRKERMKNEMFETFTKALDLEVIKKHLDNSNRLEDAWGGKIYYCSPGKFNKGTFDLVSAGPDGEFSSDNAAAPTGITDLGKFREDDGTRLCDDLFNF